MPCKQFCLMSLSAICLGLIWVPAGSASYAIYVGKESDK